MPFKDYTQVRIGESNYLLTEAIENLTNETIKNSPNCGKDVKVQVEEAVLIPSRHNQKRICRHNIIN